jgi:hypothetical protein
VTAFSTKLLKNAHYVVNPLVSWARVVTLESPGQSGREVLIVLTIHLETVSLDAPE